ncbi:MAG: DUF4350 domain-containing protein [Polyangiaceae bacterium]
MSRLMRASLVCLAVVTAASTLSRSSFAALDPSRAQADADSLRIGHDAFCTKPQRPLSRRARDLCPLAGELTSCTAFADACAQEKLPEPKVEQSSWSEAMKSALAAIAKIGVWFLIAAIVAAILFPIIQLILRRRRDRTLADPAIEASPDPQKNVAVEELVSTSDAELLLRRADEHARKGDLAAALFTYLNASLRALDTRGAIRVARHRTNGEYVRGCKDENARGPLRELVLEVDKAQFGGQKPTSETVAKAGARAVSLVRALPIALLLLFTLAACNKRVPATNTDPAGDELMTELLRKQGVKVSRLRGSLANLPIPKPDADPPAAVLIDGERTLLEPDTKAHLLAWVEAGGFLILTGAPENWPALGLKEKSSTSRDIDVYSANELEDEEDDESEVVKPRVDPVRIDHGKVAEAAALDWADDAATAVALTGDRETYAALRRMKRGSILAIANGDLLTNASLTRTGNPAALVAILSNVDRTEIRTTRPEDGISPPTNPISGLARAGLGLGMWHALAATMLVFFAVGARVSRPKPTRPPQRRAFSEHVEATGALYARTASAPHALAAYTRYAAERLRAKLPRGVTDPVQFLSQRSGVSAEECARVWRRATNVQAGDAPQGDELTVLKQLSAIYTAAMKAD